MTVQSVTHWEGDGPGSRRRWPLVVTATGVVVAIVVAGWFVFARTDRSITVHANFAYVNGIYTGSQVTVLGVPVGTVTDVQPQGTTVRVSMSMPEDVPLPADASAYVLSPAVIADRHVELGPTYTGGPKLEDGADIPAERSHAPLDFDSLMNSISTLTDAVESETGSTSQLLTKAADGWRGRGEEFNEAIRNLSSATGVVGARAEDVGALVENLSGLMAALDARQVSLDQLVRDMGAVGDQWAAADVDIAGPLQDLQVVLDQVRTFMDEHGDDVGAAAANVTALTDVMVKNKVGLAEFMDLVPLLMQNLSNSIDDETQRGRIRLNISTALTQFSVAGPLCEQYPLPLCTGAGFTNPIPFPVSAADPLNIAPTVTGGAAPSGGN
ncbi:MCE family protein [Rhodococcus gannanensis]|uniref:MCE family protein n=1 Tax=Rhodococcus gannanensis TaxID=1960308 RepID=A0ABW4PAQ3_9NOCA